MLSLRPWGAASRLRLASQLVRHAQTATAISRRDDYAVITDADIAHFRSILGDRGVVTDPDALQPLNKCGFDLAKQITACKGLLRKGCFLHGRDWMNKYEGSSKIALKPRNTEQVSQILKHCNKQQLAVVPQVSMPVQA